jgi:hypothetical protein
VACRVLVNAPWNQLPTGAGPRGDTLADEYPAQRDNPLVSSREVADQNVEMDNRPRPAPGRGLGFASGALE